MWALLKPAPFKVRKTGDPEQLLQDFELYVKTFKKFLTATGMDGQHRADHVANAEWGVCGGYVKAKSTLELVAGPDMENLFQHVGMVEDTDNFQQTLAKVADGIKKQTNQASAKFKLFQQMPQGGKAFADWFPNIREQADRCDWMGYDSKMAARDAILFQMDDKKLMKKIVSEDISFDDTVKFGLAL